MPPSKLPSRSCAAFQMHIHLATPCTNLEQLTRGRISLCTGSFEWPNKLSAAVQVLVNSSLTLQALWHQAASPILSKIRTGVSA